MMEKIAVGYYRFNEEHYPSDNVRVDMQIELIDGKELDTTVSISGKFTVAGSLRHDFLRELGGLIDRHRI